MAEQEQAPETDAQTPEAQEPEETQQETTPEQPKDELPEAVKDILAKERKAARDAEKARKAAEARVKEYEDRDKSSEEKLAENLAHAEKARDEATAKLARFEVATEKRLPGDLVGLLDGSREEMEAKADLLLNHIKDGQGPPDFGGGARQQAPVKDTPENEHNKLILGLLGREST